MDPVTSFLNSPITFAVLLFIFLLWFIVLFKVFKENSEDKKC